MSRIRTFRVPANNRLVEGSLARKEQVVELVKPDDKGYQVEDNVSNIIVDTSGDVIAEMRTLLNDYQELKDREISTDAIEKQISARIIILKDVIRTHIENSQDIPVELDGELLIYRASSRERKYVDDEVNIDDPTWPRKIGLETEDGLTYYMYDKRTIYNFDVDEANLSQLIRFVNSKTEYTPERLLRILECLEESRKIHYGYRKTFLTCVDEKADPEKNKETTVFEGTVYNNSQYSKQTDDLIKRLLLKIKSDYIERSDSDYEPEELIIQKRKGHWLIIHKGSGAADFLTEEEGKVVRAIGQVQLNFDADKLLFNDPSTDSKIRMLQTAATEYIYNQREDEEEKVH